MSREEVAARLRAAAPVRGARLADELAPAVRFAIRKEPDAGIDVGQSKFGGAPDLPQGARWPHWDPPEAERRPMHFFAQIDLAVATQAAPGPLRLPAEGLLSFFADFETPGETGHTNGYGPGISGRYPWEREGATVVYSPAGVLLHRRSPRRPPLPSGQLLAVGAWTWSRARPAEIDVPDPDAGSLDAVDQQYEVELRDQAPEGSILSARHQLGGHGRFLRRPVEEEVVKALAGCNLSGVGFDEAAWERARPQVAEWRVLLQLDSDEVLEVEWGVRGALSWAARHADASAGMWDAGMFNFQSA